MDVGNTIFSPAIIYMAVSSCRIIAGNVKSRTHHGMVPILHFSCRRICNIWSSVQRFHFTDGIKLCAAAMVVHMHKHVRYSRNTDVFQEFPSIKDRGHRCVFFRDGGKNKGTKSAVSAKRSNHFS